MSREIDREILDQATECTCCYGCQSDDWEPCGAGMARLGQQLVEMADVRPRPCAYRTAFAGDTYCSCPVRNELYRKYGI